MIFLIGKKGFLLCRGKCSISLTGKTQTKINQNQQIICLFIVDSLSNLNQLPPLRNGVHACLECGR